MNCYEGKGTYIFLSYAHKNTNAVMPIFERLFESGFRIWYDAGIEAGTEWPEYVADHLQKSACCVAFMTKEFLDSHNCRQELNFALTKNIPVLAVYLEKVTLTAGMEMRLGLSQAMYYDRFPDRDEFIKALCDASILSKCKGKKRAARKKEAPPEPKSEEIPVSEYIEAFNFEIDDLSEIKPLSEQEEQNSILDAYRWEDIADKISDVDKLSIALELAVEKGRISASTLQKSLSIGYAKASALLSQMEKLGYVGALEGKKPRRVLVTPDQLEEKLAENQFLLNLSKVDSPETFLKALVLAVNAGKASTSILQRKLSIGYGSAARILDEMEQFGYVAPPCGIKPREVLLSKDELLSMLEKYTSA